MSRPRLKEAGVGHAAKRTQPREALAHLLHVVLRTLARLCQRSGGLGLGLGRNGGGGEEKMSTALACRRNTHAADHGALLACCRAVVDRSRSWRSALEESDVVFSSSDLSVDCSQRVGRGQVSEQHAAKGEPNKAAPRPAASLPCRFAAWSCGRACPRAPPALP